MLFILFVNITVLKNVQTLFYQWRFINPNTTNLVPIDAIENDLFECEKNQNVNYYSIVCEEKMYLVIGGIQDSQVA